MTFKRDDAIWAAGLLEGEGCFYQVKRTKSFVPMVACSMTDGDIILKLKSAFGVGNVIGPRLPTSKRKDGGDKKPYWTWQITRREDSFAVLAAIYQFMGERRGQKIKELLIGYKNDKNPNKSKMPKGSGGVYFDKRIGRTGKWTAYISKGSKKVYNGSYETESLARAANRTANLVGGV